MPFTMGEQSHCDQRDKGKGKADQRDVTVRKPTIPQIGYDDNFANSSSTGMSALQWLNCKKEVGYAPFFFHSLLPFPFPPLSSPAKKWHLKTS